jgi:hypothetical protein
MGNLTYDAKRSFRFANDTVVNCSAPLKIESGNDGLSYVWVLPDGSNRTSTSVQAMTSGNYVLYMYTNYGSMVTVDTVYALIFFEEGQKINYSSTGGTKVGSTVTLSCNPLEKSQFLGIKKQLLLCNCFIFSSDLGGIILFNLSSFSLSQSYEFYFDIRLIINQ